MIKIAIGSDHAGVEYKAKIIDLLTSKGIEVQDFGPFSTDSVDYPDFIHPVADAVDKNKVDKGIILCGSGNGAQMSANKHKKVRCALTWNKEVCVLAVQHNNANIISIPARYVSLEECLEIVTTYLKGEFEGGRHQRRVDKIHNFNG